MLNVHNREWASEYQWKIKFCFENKISYEDYLCSDHWKTTREMKTEMFPVCELCGGKGNHVHHRTYKTLGKEHINDLATLCADCHEFAHVSPPWAFGVKTDNTKRTLKEEFEFYINKFSDVADAENAKQKRTSFYQAYHRKDLLNQKRILGEIKFLVESIGEE